MAGNKDRRTIRRERKMGFWRRHLVRISKPRLCVFKSARHFQAQVIDDERQVTLISVSSMEKDLRDSTLTGVQMAEKLGAIAAKRAADHNITTVVFDRNGYPYHGRISKFADSARGAGLQF